MPAHTEFDPTTFDRPVLQFDGQFYEMYHNLLQAETPAELLQTFVQPLFADIPGSATLLAIENNSDDIPESAVVLATWTPSDSPVQSSSDKRFRLQDFALGEIIKSDQENTLYLFPDLSHSYRLLHDTTREGLRSRGIQSLVILRLDSPGGKWHGVVSITWSVPVPELPDAFRDLCLTFAPQLALLLENQQMFARTRYNLHITRQLYGISRGLVEAQTYDDVLKTIMRYTSKQGAFEITLYLIEYDEGDAPAYAWTTATTGDGPTGTRFPLNQYGLSIYWMQSPYEILLIENSTTDPRLDDATRQAIAARGIEAQAIIPLMQGREWQAVIGIHWSEPHPFTEDERLVYSRIMPQVAAVVSSIRTDENYEAALEQLARQETLYRSVVEDQTELICRFDGEGRLLFVNENYCRYFSKTCNELIGKTFVPLIPQEDQHIVNETMARLSPENPVVTAEHRVILPDGQIRWHQWTDRLVNTDPLEFQAVGRDITRIKQVEMELRAANEQLSLMFENMPVIFYTCEAQAPFAATYMSESIRGVTGFNPDQFTADPGFWADHIHPEDRQRVFDGLQHLFEHDTHTHEYRWRTATGNYIWFWDALRLVRKPDGTPDYIIGVWYDITERKISDNAIHELNQSLEARTTELETINAELEAFTYSVSHDLQAPLRAIDGFSKILVKNYRDELPPKTLHYFDRIISGVERMRNLIEDLLRLSRVGRQDMQIRSVDMNALVAEVIEELPVPDSAQITVHPLPPCTGDASLLRQVFANLAGNAVKYSSKEEQPEIVIGVREDDEAERPVYFVQDNGTGFDMAYAHKLFKIFQRLHSSEYEGTGIGLAIVHRVIKRHNGIVMAEGEPDKGATFYFTIGEVEND